MKELLRRTLHPQVKVIDAANGIVDYVASDETIDYAGEVIRAKGWRFTNFAKNSPFVDSHDTTTIAKAIGQVIDWSVVKNELRERVQWAIGLGNTVADIGWKMTEAGFLKAVSVGFYPEKIATRWDTDRATWLGQLRELELGEDGIRTVYIEQEQVELSACILGCNPNAVARAHKAGALVDEDLDRLDKFLSTQIATVKTDDEAVDRGVASPSRRRARLALLLEMQKAIHTS